MDISDMNRVKWPYVTHRMDRSLVTGILPAIPERNPGAVMLARIKSLGRHRELESVHGAKVTIFPDDVVVGVLGDRYATDQYEGAAICSGTVGHLLAIGGVCGQVVTRNEKMGEPTTIEWLGRLAGPGGRPLNLGEFGLDVPAVLPASRPKTILSVGAAMNSGKTTTAAQIIYSLSRAGHRVAAAKITGTACRKDPAFMADAGAVRVYDFTWFGHPSTAGIPREKLLTLAHEVRLALLAEQPEYIVYEIADGIVQRETRLLLEDPQFRETIDVTTFAGPDGLSCESGVRMLRELGYNVVATAGLVANSRLGMAEAMAATGLPCLNGEMLMGGALLETVLAERAA